ncbi:homocysteine S-methyltransferase family protein [Ancylobacter mangrovi]|uniref:homocysteine S-methyltransferase family protein n=1 Tax=Ancylobacter mangrovi TaxID=2972472 RepID=UPI0021618F03|nr:homocysteine S-methyltransferase family protein [Ancylobacter mangrovi]MCS0501841.1 homocysteine S-methyltransferase family protein [Ancylobacter mangrovi]
MTCIDNRGFNTVRAKYRDELPLLADRLFLMDGGMETSLIFHEGIDLPHFAAIDLMRRQRGREALRAYYARFLELARERGTGFVMDAPSWRASADWAAPLGLTQEELGWLNRTSIGLMSRLRERFETPATPIVLSGVVGPRGDGYTPGARMTAGEAADYHAWQIGIFADTSADMVSAYTLNYVEEAIGVALAAREAGLPSAISFTLETDGRLPSGQALAEAIEQVDDATDAAPVYFMINCAHPTHFDHIVAGGGAFLDRIRGLRANASMRSHAELDSAPDLDDGNPVELGRQYRDLRGHLRRLNVVGGCCGTDFRHVEQICFACQSVDAA